MKEKLALQLKVFSNEEFSEMTIINFSQGGSEKSGPTSKSSTISAIDLQIKSRNNCFYVYFVGWE